MKPFWDDWNTNWTCSHAWKSFRPSGNWSGDGGCTLDHIYGAVLVNAFVIPLKNKITYRSGREVLKMNIIVTDTWNCCW